MSKKNKNKGSNIGYDLEKVEIDPRIEKAIFCKKNSIVTFNLVNLDGSDENIKFDVNYDAQKDDYQIGYNLVHKAKFYGFMRRFAKEAKMGVIVVRTFLDEISHMVYTAEHGVAIPFKEIRMFVQINGKINVVDVVSAFQAMVTDRASGKMDWNLVDKSEIFCDGAMRVSAEEIKSVFIEVSSKK